MILHYFPLHQINTLKALKANLCSAFVHDIGKCTIFKDTSDFSVIVFLQILSGITLVKRLAFTTPF